MSHTYDTIVLGLGAMGSSAAYFLSKSGKKILGLEQFSIAHGRGSSHGKSRLIRKAYFEHPNYVPLLHRSYELWEELCQRTGKNLFHQTGLVIYGPKEGGKVLPGVRKSSQEYGIEVEELSAVNAETRFPLLKVPKGFEAIYEPGAGFLEVENCVQSYCEEAVKKGADLKFEEEVLFWKSNGNSVTVETSKGKYEAENLIVTAGPWSSNLLKNLGMELKVQRVPMFWFNADENYSEEKSFPCFAYDMTYGFIYGFPSNNKEGMKIAPHIAGDLVTDPTNIDRKSTVKELAPVIHCIQECIPGIESKITHEAMCMYTMTKDSNFIIDLHPEYKNVAIACGFSGHGFKFSSVVGEILKDLTVDRKTKYPIDFLKVRTL